MRTNQFWNAPSPISVLGVGGNSPCKHGGGASREVHFTGSMHVTSTTVGFRRRSLTQTEHRVRWQCSAHSGVSAISSPSPTTLMPPSPSLCMPPPPYLLCHTVTSLAYAAVVRRMPRSPCLRHRRRAYATVALY